MVERTRALMARAGQEPIRLRREFQGFAANRSQAALIGAALRMVKDGIASAADVDIAIRDGIGPALVVHGAARDDRPRRAGRHRRLPQRYGPRYKAIEGEHAPHEWTDERLPRQIEDERRKLLPAARLAERGVWRDRRLMALAAQKREAAEHIGE
jgi:hypothetical protein